MNYLKALRLFETLSAASINDYKIEKLINHGKSAAVFKASNSSGEIVAIKIFDDEIVDKFGFEIQRKRIEQEIALKDHTIENLVKILSGGKFSFQNVDFWFIIMEYVPGINLREFIKSQVYSIDFVCYIGKTILEVSEKLIDSYNLVHRDIKPENIMINSNREAILMDLGVLKLIGSDSGSDIETKQFLGTLRYAPPEFLMRTEKDTIDGWRAVNLYQIGGVLYELIEKSELFHDEEPYSNLVIAIKEKTPPVRTQVYPFTITQLVRNLLVKDWELRLKLNEIPSILESLKSEDRGNKQIESRLSNLMHKTAENNASFKELVEIHKNISGKINQKKELVITIFRTIYEILQGLSKRGLFRKLDFSPATIPNWHQAYTELISPYYFIIRLFGGLEQGFSHPIHLMFQIITTRDSATQVNVVGVIMDENELKECDIGEPEKYIDKINALAIKERLKDTVGPINIQFVTLFEGVFDTEDEGLKIDLQLKLICILERAILKMSDRVKKIIQTQKYMASNGIKVYLSVPSPSILTFIHEI